MVLSRKAIVFIAAVLYLVLGHWLGFLTVNAAILLWLGFEWFSRDRSRWAVALMAVCALIILIHQFELFAALVLISLAIFLLKDRSAPTGTMAGRHRLYLAMRQEDETWMLRSFASWHLVGEVRLDLTRAVPEEPETTIVLQGIAGDVDLIVPEDWGINIDASVLVGQIKWPRSPEGAGVNRLSWRSPDYEHRPVRVNVQAIYLIGDIKILPG